MRKTAHCGLSSHRSTTSCRWQLDFTLLNSVGRVGEGLLDVFLLKVWICLENLLPGMSTSNQSNNGTEAHKALGCDLRKAHRRRVLHHGEGHLLRRRTRF